MWFDDRRDIFYHLREVFLCMLPPDEFAKFGYDYQNGKEALLQRMKEESCHSNFSKLNQDSFGLDGQEKLPIGPNYESWEAFLQNEGSGHEKQLKKRLWQHIRILAAGINQNLEATYAMFWRYRVDEALRADAYRKIFQYLRRNSVDKVRGLMFIICLSQYHLIIRLFVAGF